jgi:hypothetical protein
VAEEGEACSSVHLARDPLGLGVDTLGGAVAVRKREGGVHGVAVSWPPAGGWLMLKRVNIHHGPFFLYHKNPATEDEFDVDVVGCLFKINGR